MLKGRIRPVALSDAKAIIDIYNHYILNTTASFETEPLSEEQMRSRIASIVEEFPYFVYEEEGEVQGFCYAHLWKERPAYHLTLETSVYIHKDRGRKGIGTALMHVLMGACRKQGYKVLIACITGENSASIAMHERLGFKHVSRFNNVGFKLGRFLDVVDLAFPLD